MSDDAGQPGEGLTSAEAAARLARYGPNQPAPDHAPPPLGELFALFTNPLSVILLAAAGVSAGIGDATGAVVIVVIVVAGAAINFVQTFRSARAIRRLREGVAVTATVRRDGRWREVVRSAVVPGDVVRLSAGDLVPADCRLLTARDLHVQQAALTGESLPVEKAAGPPRPDRPLTPDDADAVFFGTSVVGGTATAEVLATGRGTAFGALAARLADRPPETEFDRGTRRFGVFITQTVVALVLFVLLANLALRRDPVESLLFAVALAVGMTPEFLPMITAVTLAAGAVRMARQKVVVKHLAAMQNLGSMDVLCSDKTGTLTVGEMALTVTVDPLGEPAERPFELAYLNSANETGIRSPLDAAVLARRPVDVAAFAKVDEIPFDFERRRLSVAVDGPGGRQLITKGAPESVLPCCTRFEADGRAEPLDADARAKVAAVCAGFAGQGYRLLAVAVKASDRPAFGVADEADLTLVGLLGFVDPPRPDAAEVIRALRAGGVAVKVLSGDNDLVARHVCAQVGLTGRVVVGDEIDRTSDAALGAVVEEAVVFARLNPAQKTRALAALKARGHVVGFLGDGVNDAPALRTADVGITVSTAADVAKDAAEVVLLEPGLGVLRAGIQEGRRAFGNVTKYLLMETSSNFGNMLSMAAAAALLPFLPMLPKQILLNSFLYDAAQLPIPTDPVDAEFVRTPRRWDVGGVRRFMLVAGPVSSLFDLLTFAVLLHAFRADATLFHTGWFVESLATQTLVLLVIRTAGNPLRSRPSRWLVGGVALTTAAGFGLPYSFLAGPLGFAPLPAAYLVFIAATVALYLLAIEAVKRKTVGGPG